MLVHDEGLTTDSTFEDAVTSVKRSRAELGRDLDLALVHWPVPGKHVDMYRALVHCKEELKIVKELVCRTTRKRLRGARKVWTGQGLPTSSEPDRGESFLYRKECVDYFQEKHIVCKPSSRCKGGRIAE